MKEYMTPIEVEHFLKNVDMLPSKELLEVVKEDDKTRELLADIRNVLSD
jgi:hypothetical protein